MRTTSSIIVGLLLFATAALTTSGCGTTRDGATGGDPVQLVDLTAYFKRVPGVIVQGNGSGADIRVRGMDANELYSHPLYVIDGIEFGFSYTMVYDIVRVEDIKRIWVLKGPEGALNYSRGSNGVVVIETKYGQWRANQ